MEKIFRFICCGNVDDGKSTLIGRLLFQTGNVKKDQIEDALKASKRLASEKFEYSMLLDGLLAEREQQITIDVAHRYFNYKNVRFHILDCPGHKQYTKNMAIAAAISDSAVLVVDITKGISKQTLEHINICKKFRLKNLCCCLTKIDLLEYSVKNTVIEKLKKELNFILSDFENLEIIPVSADTGYNIDRVLNKIYEFSQTNTSNDNENKILHVHMVKKHNNKRYCYALPINHKIPIKNEKYYLYSENRVIKATIEENISYGCFMLKENIDVQQGDVFSLKPLKGCDLFNCDIVWFDKKTDKMLLKHGTKIVKILSISKNKINLDGQVFASNIKKIKENALGIIIDDLTKKTLGCVIFKNGVVVKANESNKKIKTNNIFFDKKIISKLGEENINEIKNYLLKQGYVVETEK